MNHKEALNYSMNLCSKQECCRSEIRVKLEKYGLNEADIERILAELEKEKFIDETRFANVFAGDKMRLNRWGRIKIRHMLYQKQIAGEIIDEALEKLDKDEYDEILRGELVKKKRTLRSGSRWEVRGKLFGFARQRGFEPDLINRLLNKELE